MRTIKKFNELFGFRKERKVKNDMDHRSEKYRGYDIKETTFPDDWRHDPEWAGKTRYQIWTIPADFGPAFEGEGTIETAKQFLDNELKKSPVYKPKKGASPVYQGAKGTGILYTGESVKIKRLKNF